MAVTETLFIGTYSKNILFGTGETLVAKGRGIGVAALSPDGMLNLCEKAFETDNPSFVCVSEDKKHLYCVNELKEYNGKPGGSVSAFAIERDGGEINLRYLNTQPTKGTDPCHIAINRGKTHVYASNFMSGSVCVIPVLPDGSLGEPSDFKQFEGSGKDPKRQASPHAHSLTFSPDEKTALVPDLGTDRVMLYAPDFKNGTLIPKNPAYFQADAGSGPRFSEFHPNGKWCYLINELASSVSLLEYDGETGGLKKLQTVPTIPADYKGDNICADLHVTADGRFLYASNRGHNTIAIFSVSAETGELSHIKNIFCGGKTPRNFAISLSGEYLVVANQDSDNILSYKIGKDGMLELVDEIKAGTPVCVCPVIF